jgi:hypothetical protein
MSLRRYGQDIRARAAVELKLPDVTILSALPTHKINQLPRHLHSLPTPASPRQMGSNGRPTRRQ